MTWSFIATAHLAVLLVALLVLWAAGWHPQEVATWIGALFQSRPVAMASAAGVSLLTVVFFYFRLLRWVHKFAGGPLADYLMKGLA